MAKAGLYYPTEERIYQLKDLCIPPRGYDRFLRHCLEKVEEIVLDEYHCSSLEEMAEKYLRRMKKLNPDKDVNELREYPLVCTGQATLEYETHKRKVRGQDGLYRSVEYRDDLLAGERRNRIIPIDDPQESLASLVEDFNRALNARYRSRDGRLSMGLPLRRVGMKTKAFLDEFELGIKLTSFPLSLLEVEVVLQGYGAMSDKRVRKFYSIPAIRLQAKQLVAGSLPLSLSRRFTEELGRLVEKHYDVGTIAYRTKHEQRDLS